MAKKRPTLDAFLTAQNSDTERFETNEAQNSSKLAKSVKKAATEPKVIKKPSTESKPDLSTMESKQEIIRHMLYLPVSVYDQLQDLIFQEQRGQSKRRKTHDYLLDAIDLLFKEKGLKSIDELAPKNK